MEGYASQRNNTTDMKDAHGKQKQHSRRLQNRSHWHSTWHTHSEKLLQSENNPSDVTSHYVPLEERVLKRLKRERRYLKKWTVELNQAKSEIHSTTADEFASVDSKIADIQKRYSILLPAIQLAMETMEQATSIRSSLKDRHDNLSKNDTYDIHDKENATQPTIAERERPKMKERKERSFEKHIRNPDSINSLMTDFSKQQLAKEARYQKFNRAPCKVQDIVKPDGAVKDPNLQTASGNCQPNIRLCTAELKEPSAQHCKPGADGETTNNIKESSCEKPTVLVKEKVPDTKHVKDDEREKRFRQGLKSVQNTIQAQRKGALCIKNHPGPNFKMVEQNVLCTGPKPTTSTESTNSIAQSERSFNATSKPSTHIIESSSGNAVCRCKDKKNGRPCICKCNCEEQSDVCDSNITEETVPSSPPTSSSDEGRPFKKKPSLEPKNVESIRVQTSFPSSIGPCNPQTCPKRKRRLVENRAIEVQTDDTDIEWQYEPPASVKKTPVKKNTPSVFQIPPKRTPTMDDRLGRRITYFDSHPTSVCNKDVEFCTYNIHQTKKGFPKNAQKVPCADCPGSRKCDMVFTQKPNHLTCNEVVVEVASMELNQEGVDSLTKVCSFVYIDYVFLGHVGNETNLAPVSSNIIFDSRKSYCVSLRFNKKERSILREQVNPSGLLVKDSIMFIVVCHAAPEYDINKNWDFGFGYMSMKQIGERIGSEDKMYVSVDMQKIGGTKNNFGRLQVTIEGLKTIKSIMNEELHCMEPRVNAVMEKLKLNKKELTAAENNQTTCQRRKSKEKKKRKKKKKSKS